MMNCSATSTIESRYFLGGNFGASVFMTTYIGLYGMGLIVYFAFQLMNETKESHENEIPTHFFSTYRSLNERLKIYNQLINENWVKEIYEIYYCDQPCRSNTIEGKVNDCLRKYQKKIENLQCKHTYYVTETSTPSPRLTSIACID